MGGGYSGEVKTQKPISAQICLNLNWGEGGTRSQNRVNWDFLTKFSTTPASQIVSHMWRLINFFELRNYVVNIKVITTLYLDFDCVLNHPLPLYWESNRLLLYFQQHSQKQIQYCHNSSFQF